MKWGGQSSNVRAGETTTKAGVLPREGRRRLIWVPIIHTEADLMARGAAIMRTESPELLLEEYNLARKTLAPPGRRGPRGAGRRGDDPGKALLAPRDRYIARRVAETLRPGETGLIFLGMLHSLAGRLPPDIEVIR